MDSHLIPVLASLSLCWHYWYQLCKIALFLVLQMSHSSVVKDSQLRSNRQMDGRAWASSPQNPYTYGLCPASWLNGSAEATGLIKQSHLSMLVMYATHCRASKPSLCFSLKPFLPSPVVAKWKPLIYCVGAHILNICHYQWLLGSFCLTAFSVRLPGIL